MSSPTPTRAPRRSSSNWARARKRSAKPAVNRATKPRDRAATPSSAKPNSRVAKRFSSAPAKVQLEALNVLTANPCGDLASYAAAPATDLANLGRIKVPVLAVQGGKDTLFPVPDVKTQSTLYTGSSKVTFATLPKSAHALTLESEHGKLEAIVAKFLTGNGL